MGIRGSNRDITRRKGIEGVLFDNKYYQLIFDISPDSIVVGDMNLRIRTVNQCMVELLGYRQAEEMTRKNLSDLIFSSDQGRVKLREVMKTEHVRDVEFSMMKKDGGRLSVVVNTSLIHEAHGNPEAIIFVARNVTESRKMEEKLN